LITRDALVLLQEAKDELKAHEIDYHHVTRKGLVDDIEKLLFDVGVGVSVIKKKERS